jgi:hypothetical protein
MIEGFIFQPPATADAAAVSIPEFAADAPSAFDVSDFRDDLRLTVRAVVTVDSKGWAPK